MSEDRFRTLSTETVYVGRSTVRLERVRTPAGEEVEREIVGHDDAVAIVPLTPDGDVVLLRQYRQALRDYVLEIPAGTLDADDASPEEAAARELAEETGYAADALEHLATFANSAGWTDERTHVFLARDVHHRGHPEGFVAEDEEADMAVVHLDLAQAVTRTGSGELEDAKTLIGLLLAAARD